MNLKRVLGIGLAVLTISASSVTGFAATVSHVPAQIVAELTGRTVEDVRAEKTRTGKTYGRIAEQAGKLAEFQKATLQNRKDSLAKKVSNGTLSQAQADAAIQTLEENQANCDGSGNRRGTGICDGTGQQGNGDGNNDGQGNGQGRGQGRRDGSCRA